MSSVSWTFNLSVLNGQNVSLSNAITVDAIDSIAVAIPNDTDPHEIQVTALTSTDDAIFFIISSSQYDQTDQSPPGGAFTVHGHGRSHHEPRDRWVHARWSTISHEPNPGRPSRSRSLRHHQPYCSLPHLHQQDKRPRERHHSSRPQSFLGRLMWNVPHANLSGDIHPRASQRKPGHRSGRHLNNGVRRQRLRGGR